MKKITFLLIVLGSFGFTLENKVTPRKENCDYNYPHMQSLSPTQIRIDGGGAIIGSAGKNICADTTGNNIAVIYASPSGDPYNIFKIKIAYSTNCGATWRLFGPFSGRYPYYRRCYSGIDGRPYYWVNQEAIFGCWHEAYYRNGAYVDSSPQVVAFDSAYFPNGRFIIKVMSGSGNPAHNMWLPCIAVRPDNKNIVFTTGVGYDFGSGGGTDIYGWLSTDGGYTWSNPIWIAPGDAPHIRFGTGGYLFAYFQRDTAVGNDTLLWPYYIESTDGGLTWIPANGKLIRWSGFPPYPQFSLWWYNYDCEVINNEPYVVISPGVPGYHCDQVWFLKGSGPIGNRIWTATRLMGTNNPVGDSIAREVSIASGKDIPRFEKSIAITANVTCSTGTDTRLWISKDLGQSWEYRGKLNINASPEMAHILSRHQNLTSAIAHFVFELSNAIYYEWKEIPNFIYEIEETDSRRPIANGGMKILQNPARREIRIQMTENRSQIKIYDVNGKLLKVCRPSEDGRYRAIVLNPGVYFVRVETENKVTTKKVVVVE